MGGPDATMLLTTKLRPPGLRNGVVIRRRLFAALDAGVATDGGVTLVCAPAGWGKTTVVSSWLSRQDHRIGWLQLDEDDDDPARFTSHLVAMVASLVDHDIDVDHHELLRVVDAVVGHLDDEHQRTIVLDDLHLVGNPDVHVGLDRLLHWLPPTAHVVVISRSEPPLPRLPRMRASGLLGEIRADDLAFSGDEAGELLSNADDAQLPDGTVERLVARTEGWGAGLYLAMLSIQRSTDAASFVDRFAGDERLVADYLRSELIDGLDAETRQFVLQTSVLDEMCGSLCDAVVGRSGSTGRLRRLARDNLLLIPLDTEGEWYRSHHLLRDWLRAELFVEEIDTAELHVRSAEWHRTSGSPEAAIRHAIESGDVDLLGSIVEASWRDAFAAGRLVALRRWFEALGDDAIADRPALCLARAHVGMNAGEPPDVVAQWMERAEHSDDVFDPVIAGQLQRNRSIQSRLVGDLAAAEDQSRAAIELLVDDREVTEARALLGAVLYLRGDVDAAAELLAGAITRASSAADQLIEQFAMSFQAMILDDQGHRTEASNLARETIELAADTSLASHPTLVPSYLVLGHHAIDDGDLDRATESVEHALERAAIARNLPSQVLTLLAAARLAAAQRHGVEARRRLAEARALVEQMPDPGMLPSRLAVTERQLAGGQSPNAGDPDVGLIEDLTDRELAVLRLLPSDLSVREIGAELYVSHNTVKGHLKAIYRKLLVTSRAECVARARSVGLL